MECSLDHFSFGKYFKDFEYDFEPETGRLRVAWNGVKILSKRTGQGVLIGGFLAGFFTTVGGIALSIITKSPGHIYQGALVGSSYGVAGGAVIGFTIGSIESYVCVKELRALESVSRESAEKTKLIFNAFMQKNLQKANENDSIFCSISHEIFSFPVETQCKHVFDYEGIRKWIEEKKEQNLDVSCPTCRSPISLSRLGYREDIDRKVAMVVNKFFEKLSKIINEHTHRYEAKDRPFFGKERFYCQKAEGNSWEFFEKISKEIQINGPLSRTGVNEIVERIENNTLKEKDAYIMSMLLAKSVENFQNKNDEIFNRVKRKIHELSERREISDEEYSNEMNHLILWHRALSVKQ